MGPCAMAHPEVMILAFLLFVGLEIAAFPRFVRAARTNGKFRWLSLACGSLRNPGVQRVHGILLRSRLVGYKKLPSILNTFVNPHR